MQIRNMQWAVLEQKWDNCSVYFMQNCGAASLMRLRRRQIIWPFCMSYLSRCITVLRMLHWRKHRNRAQRMKKKAEQPGQRSRFHPQNRSGRSYTGMPVITAMYFLQTGFWSRSIRPFLLRQIWSRRRTLIRMNIYTVLASTFPKMNWEQHIIWEIFRRRLYRRWQMSIQKVTGSDLLIPERICQKRRS